MSSTTFRSYHGEWSVAPQPEDRHFLVISPLGVVYRRYPTYHQARVAAEKMATAMLSREEIERELEDPCGHRDPDTQARLESFLESLMREEDHDQS